MAFLFLGSTRFDSNPSTQFIVGLALHQQHPPRRLIVVLDGWMDGWMFVPTRFPNFEEATFCFENMKGGVEDASMLDWQLLYILNMGDVSCIVVHLRPYKFLTEFRI